MTSCIIVHPRFDYSWPFSADYFHELWKEQGDVVFIRLDPDDTRPVGQIIPEPDQVDRLVCLQVPVTVDCLKAMKNLREAVLQTALGEDERKYIKDSEIRIYHQPSEGFWGQTVSEFGLALTLCGLRRIPQIHHEILSSQDEWRYGYKTDQNGPLRGAQFGDDPYFTNGTAKDKKVRIVGAGNIGSRYASFMNMLDADVAIWDPFASDPCFHRAGARREWHLDELVKDADIFAPMLPLKDDTRGIVTAEHIHSLPKGCLVVLVTRALICDMQAVRQRVLDDEITLAADVFDIEPLPLDDPLLGRHNVVHTPHRAGRTMDANKEWVSMLAAQFLPR